MKTKPQREALNTLLSSLVFDDELRAVCVQGEWGVGKTYSVRDYFESDELKTRLQKLKFKFAYISLFGADSIETVRERLCAAALENGKLITAALKKFQGTANLAGYGNVALAGAGSLISEGLQKLALKRLIICIDDLERIGRSLPQEDVLGLIAEMVERHESKCILLFNGGRLAPEAAEQLAVTEEKLFDLRFVFSPSARENIAHAGLLEKDKGTVLEVFEAFEISNIRVMRRAAWLIRFVKRFYPKGALSDQIVEHCAALSILKHSFAKEVPDLGKAIAPAALGRILFGGKDPSGLPAVVEKAVRELRFTGLPYTDSLIEILETGQVDQDSLELGLKEAEKEFKNRRFERSVDELLDEFYKRFGGSANSLADRFFELLKNIPSDVPLKRGLLPLEIFLRLDPTPRSENIASKWLQAFLSDTPKEYRTRVLSGFEKLSQLPIVQKVPYNDQNARIELDKLIEQLTAHEGWTPGDFQHFVEFKATELANELREMSYGITTLRILIERLPIVMPDVAAAALDIFSKAAAEIAKGDELDRMRVDLHISPELSKAKKTLQEWIDRPKPPKA